jgi:sugar transferase (PEP-CTERM/EpsH1 system associated)
LRDYHLATQLAKRCEVTFLEVLHPDDDRAVTPPEATGFKRIVSVEKEPNFRPLKLLRGMIGPTPVTLWNYHSPAMEKTLTGLLEEENFDIVQLENVHLCVYLRAIRAAKSKPAILADWHNVDSELLWRYAERTDSAGKRMVARRTASLLEAMEKRLVRECDAVTIPSERERQKLLELAPGCGVQVLPNGVDTTYYRPEEPQESASAKNTILFVGAMDYHANVTGVQWFVREIWPAIAAAHPELEFCIVGRNPGPEVRALAADRIRVTGTVDDVRPYYTRAAAVVVPLLLGSGTRLKILEAMAAGAPIVSTRLGAEGIDCEHDVHLLLADTADEMAASVRRLLAAPAERSRLSAAARTLVASRYDWPVIADQMYAIHQRLTAGRQAVSS